MVQVINAFKIEINVRFYVHALFDYFFDLQMAFQKSNQKLTHNSFDYRIHLELAIVYNYMNHCFLKCLRNHGYTFTRSLCNQML